MSIDYSQTFLDILVPIFRPKLANGNDKYFLIQGFANADAPLEAYASIRIANIVDVGTMEEGGIDENGQQVKQHQNVTLTINTFGKGAVTAANRLRTSLEFNSMTDKLSAAGVAFRDSGDVINITQLVQSTYEERATFNIILGTADGNFVLEVDPNNDGLPSQPNYDEDIVPVEKVCVTNTVVRDNDSGGQDVVHVSSVQVNITTET